MPKPKAFVVEQRDLFDIVATNDISHLAIALGHEEVTSSSPMKSRPTDDGEEQPSAEHAAAPPSPTKQNQKTPEEKRNDVVSFRDKYGVSALHIATTYNHETIAVMLIDAGADVNAKTDIGLTPLHAAAENGHERLVNLLLEHGADPSNSTQSFITPLHLAKANKYGSIVVTLEPLTNEKTDLSKEPLAAAVEGDVLYFILKDLYGKNRELETATNETNDNCLIALCKTADLNETAPSIFEQGGVLHFLLEKKIFNVNFSNKANMTALMYAAKSGLLSAVKSLLKYEADGTLTYDEEGNETAWNLAASNEEIKHTLNVAMKEQEYKEIYAQRNEIPYKDRPAYVQQVRAAKQEVVEAEEALEEFVAKKNGGAAATAEDTASPSA